MFTDRMFEPVVAFGSVGPAYRSLACPRCATPLALVGVTTTARYFDAAVELRQHVQAVIDDLHRHQPHAAVAAYLLIRDSGTEVAAHLREVWPADPSRAVTPSEWATVRPALQHRHRYGPRTTTVRS